MALDLNKDLIQHPGSTYFVRVSGDSMVDAGIFEGDILIVDSALETRSGDIVIAVVDGELTVKRLKKADGKVFLVPENEKYEPIEISPESDFRILGVALHSIHPLRYDE